MSNFIFREKVTHVVSLCLWDEFVYCELYIIPTLVRMTILIMWTGVKMSRGNCALALKFPLQNLPENIT